MLYSAPCGPVKEPTLKIETQPHDNCTLALTVEVDDERVQPALKAAARRLAKQYRFPGFRPGKAPYETVLRQVGEAALYNEALEKLGQEVYQEALEQEKIEAFAPGELQHVELKPMVLKFIVPLRPEVELGDYRATCASNTPRPRSPTRPCRSHGPPARAPERARRRWSAPPRWATW